VSLLHPHHPPSHHPPTPTHPHQHPPTNTRIHPPTLVSRHTRSKLIAVVRTRTSATYTDIETEMKNLNDRQEFAKVLVLLDRHKHEEIPTDRVAVQALKACTRLGYLERGEIIHKKLSNRSLNNAYIQTTLIHLYSEFIV
jgi:hypothetical protein